MYFNYVHTAAHLSANADLFLQFGKFLLVHTEFLHLKSEHKHWLIHLIEHFSHCNTGNVFYQHSQTQILCLPELWQSMIHKYKDVHIHLFYQGVTKYIKLYSAELFIYFQSCLTLKPSNSVVFFFFLWHIELTRTHSCHNTRNSCTIFFLQTNLDYKETKLSVPKSTIKESSIFMRNSVMWPRWNFVLLSLGILHFGVLLRSIMNWCTG